MRNFKRFEVRSISCGANITIVLLHNGDIYITGKSAKLLGTYSKVLLKDRNHYKLSKFEYFTKKGIRITKIAIGGGFGGYNIVFLDSIGKCYKVKFDEYRYVKSWNNLTQSIESVMEGRKFFPNYVMNLPKIVDVFLTLGSFYYLDEYGHIYCEGINTEGQLGLNHLENCDIPIKNPYLHNVIDVKSFHSSESVYFNTANGKWYCCGSRYYICYRIDQNDFEKNEPRPIRVQTPFGFSMVMKKPLEFIFKFGNISDISVGENYTLILTEVGEVYSCGLHIGGIGSRISLGFGPKKITILKSIMRIKASCKSSFFIDYHKNVFVQGENECGQIFSEEGKWTIDEPIICKLKDVDLVQCGENFCVFVTLNGEIVVSGYNKDGQIGLGKDIIKSKFVFLHNHVEYFQISNLKNNLFLNWKERSFCMSKNMIQVHLKS